MGTRPARGGRIAPRAGATTPRRKESHMSEPTTNPTTRHGPRTVLVLLAAVGLILLFAAPSAAAPPSRRFPVDLERTSIAQLQQAMADHVITSRELVSGYLERIRLLNTHGPGLKPVP